MEVCSVINVLTRWIFSSCAARAATSKCSQSSDAVWENTFVFQQDSDLHDLAEETVQLLHHEVLQLISPELWPPRS